MRLQTMLHKTIVFITHDFDEAVRLGDRIAIMKDGVVIQLGTPEELVTKPADNYVAQFTREAPVGKLLSVGSIMESARPIAAPETTIDVSAKLADIAPVVLASDKPITVCDATGAAVGALTRQKLIEVLFK